MARAALILAASTLWCCALPGTAPAQRIAQPPLDLGQTSFLDGEGAPGFLLETIGLGTAAGYATDGTGRAAPGPNRQWSANVTLHPVYTSKASLLGGSPGIELLFPFSLTHLEAPDQPATTQGGAGDVTISPFTQWSGGALLGKPFTSRLALQGVAPSGSYKASRPVNGGTNVWQVSPYYALTWQPLDRWEVSVRLIYGWSSRNTAPPPALGVGSVQPGSQFAANCAASYAVTPKLRLGMSGYVLRQLADTRLGGRAAAADLWPRPRAAVERRPGPGHRQRAPRVRRPEPVRGRQRRGPAADLLLKGPPCPPSRSSCSPPSTSSPGAKRSTYFSSAR